MTGPIDRRAALRAGVLALATSLAPRPAVAGLRQLGYLADEPTLESVPVLREALAARGWVEGKTLTVWRHYTQGKPELSPRHVEAVVARAVDVIVATDAASIEAARRTPVAVPVVMVALDDPVARGWVASLAEPGGRLTGITLSHPDLGPARLALLGQLVPRLERVAALWNPDNPSAALELQAIRQAAAAGGVRVEAVALSGASPVKQALATIAGLGVQGLLVLADALAFAHREAVTAFTLRRRVPAVFPLPTFAESGGLLGYGAAPAPVFERAAVFVDRILRGARPGNLAVERAPTLELAISLKTARRLSISIPEPLLRRARRIVT